MARYIDADDAIYELERIFPVDDFKKIIRAISRTHTADVRENIHGYWIPPAFDYAWYYAKCSVCGYEDRDYHGKKENPVLKKYCSNCGNPMDGASMERSDI